MMPTYLVWLNEAATTFGAIGIICLLLAKRQAPNASIGVKLVGYIAGGLCLCCLSSSLATPAFFSPRITVTGTVRGFHEVREYRNSYFSFCVGDNQAANCPLSAHYFDKGFFFGDPAVSDGDVVTVTYLGWTRSIINIKELAGRHLGWSFEKDPHVPGIWLFAFGGIALLVGGILSVLSDVLARSGTRPNDNPKRTSSILGL
jgi:hypothetical protein